MILTPYPEYLLSARSMNDYHLALNLKLARTAYSGILYPKGFSNVPVVALWRDTPLDLINYAMHMAKEAVDRGIEVFRSEYNFFKQEYDFRRDTTKDGPPFWLGNLSWHRYHRGLMHETDQLFYTAMFLKTQVGTNFETEYKDNPDLIFKQDPNQYERQRVTAWIVNQKTAERVFNG